MDMYVGETSGGSAIGATQSHEWVCRLINILATAACELDHQQASYLTILKAASLLRARIDPKRAEEMPARRSGLSNRYARKVCAYSDSHITDGILVADLCALADLSESHFSRVFTGTFGQRPHAFVIRRRVKWAAQYTLRTEAPLRTEGRCA